MNADAVSPGAGGRQSQDKPPSGELGSIKRAFADVERRGEVFAAGSRILIAITMSLATWLSHTASPAGHPVFLVIISLIYGIISILGLALALSGRFYTTSPYMFVFLDSAVIATALTLLARMHKMDFAHEFSLPLFSMAFVVTIHAALRYRPALVVFGATVFITLLFLLPMLLSVEEGEHHQMATVDRSVIQRLQDFSPHDIGYLPLVFFLISVVLLYYIVRRTHALARLALIDGRRVAQLTRFFSPEVANHLIEDDHHDVSHGRRQMAAILFIDIRGFTRLSEDIPTDELVELLASFRTEVCGTIFDYGGTIDKFIGDAVLAVFGTPEARDDDAERAVAAALDIIRRIEAWHGLRKSEGKPAALVGVGAHYGEVFAGVIASGLILEHSVIGDAVNIAQRLERLTRDLNANIVLSDELLTANDRSFSELGLLRKIDVPVPGHSAPLTICHDQR